jgi:hypothetical protein
MTGLTAVASAAEFDTQRGKDSQAYDHAVKLLNGCKYTEAERLLTMLLEVPTIEVAHTARMRLLMLQKLKDQRNN